jgi:uncharacterized membrane protein YjgN (DUF898 family)
VDQQQAPGPDGAPLEIPFEFRGSASEYFRIWIVNVALSVVTAGIYSAWAKVRTNRYIYGNTYLDSSSFQYTARPMGILRGRALAVALFLAYYGLTRYSPVLSLAFLGVGGVVLPWLIVKSLRFRARYTRYRNVSFSFGGTYGEAFIYWILVYLLVPVTLGIIFPYIKYVQQRFMVERHRYGSVPFAFRAGCGPFYGTYILAGVLAVPLAIAAFGLSTVLISAAGKLLSAPLMMGVYYLAFVPVYLLVYVYVKVNIFNAVVGASSIAGHGLRSTQKVGEVFRLYLGNIVAVVASLGLLVPWAVIRLIRYRVEHLVLVAAGELDGFTASAEERESSVGEEIGEVFDFDIGF